MRLPGSHCGWRVYPLCMLDDLVHTVDERWFSADGLGRRSSELPWFVRWICRLHDHILYRDMLRDFVEVDRPDDDVESEYGC